MKKCELCPECGKPLPTRRTTSMSVRHMEEEYQGVPIAMHREQLKECPVCRIEGRRMIFIGETQWEHQKCSNES